MRPPACVQSISKLAFEFERRKLAIEEVRELIYREILEYHPQVLQDYLSGGRLPTFLYPSAVDNFKRQFMHLEGGGERTLTAQWTFRDRELFVLFRQCASFAVRRMLC